MERRRLADIFSISKTTLNQLFGDEPSPRHFKFQAAAGVLQRSQTASKFLILIFRFEQFLTMVSAYQKFDSLIAQ